MTWLYFAVPVALLALGFPIYQVLLLTALAVALVAGDVPLTQLHTDLFAGVNVNALLAVPFFILAGEIMGQGGIARRLVDWVLSIIGRVRGALGLTTVASAELFGAMSGSSVGCVAAIGRLLHPSLRREGYGERFAIGLIASSGAVAIVIPPSIAMIIYGIAGQVSVPKLFLAGFLPGLLIGLFAAVYVVVYARRRGLPQGDPLRWRRVAHTSRGAAWALGAPAVIFGGIYGGAFTPTEAAGIAVVYSALVSRYVYRDLTWPALWRIALNAAYLCAQILIIVAAADVYSKLLTTSGIPAALIRFVTEMRLDAWSTLLVLNLLFLVLGSFLEPPAAILILTPLVLPIVRALEIDPVHFGIVVTVNLSIGMYTPPFGLNLFAANALFGVPLGTVYRGVMPFWAINLAALAVITYVPWISLVIPNLVM
jgi:C4-dicarboxylate transporter, DctM subunit